jgi:hypothetical protein
MPGLIRCRACGYVTVDSFSGTVCPACGVPRSSFEPFEDRVSENRRKWLNHHIHPVIAHFPQAFSMTLFATIVFGYFGTCFPTLSIRFLETSRILGMILPFAVCGGFISGIIDGHIRYKRLNTPFLKLKITAGIVFIVSSFAEAGMINFAGITRATIAPLLILSILTVCCMIILGLAGGKLNCAAMGGK